ncbi:MAG: hypothetical protein ABI286_13025, partial [Edaphobacter sp.]
TSMLRAIPTSRATTMPKAAICRTCRNIPWTSTDTAGFDATDCFGLHFPQLDADINVPNLLDGVFGSRKLMAARLGAAGGSSRSKSKAAAARANGALGGRPRKLATK